MKPEKELEFQESKAVEKDREFRSFAVSINDRNSMFKRYIREGEAMDVFVVDTVSGKWWYADEFFTIHKNMTFTIKSIDE